VVPVSDLYAEPVCQEGISTGSINEKARFPDEGAAGRISAGHFNITASVKLDCGSPDTLMDADASALSVLKKYVVELRSLHLERSRWSRVECIAELYRHMPVVAWKGEVRPPLDDANADDFFHNPKLIEDRQIAGQQRFSDMETGMRVFLKKRHPPTFASE
jgi:hypothetical protein